MPICLSCARFDVQLVQSLQIMSLGKSCVLFTHCPCVRPVQSCYDSPFFTVDRTVVTFSCRLTHLRRPQLAEELTDSQLACAKKKKEKLNEGVGLTLLELFLRDLHTKFTGIQQHRSFIACQMDNSIAHHFCRCAAGKSLESSSIFCLKWDIRAFYLWKCVFAQSPTRLQQRGFATGIPSPAASGRDKAANPSTKEENKYLLSSLFC